MTKRSAPIRDGIEDLKSAILLILNDGVPRDADTLAIELVASRNLTDLALQLLMEDGQVKRDGYGTVRGSSYSINK